MGTDRGARLEEAPEDAVFCARHPEVETYLRCGKCGTPICPRCLVQTPVGARCRDCANISRLPTFNVTPVFFARGMAAAIASGVVVGVVWALLTGGAGFGFFSILIGLGVGWAVSESVSRGANGKRGLGLQICAVLGVLLAYLVMENLTPGGIIPRRGGLLFQGDLIAALVGAAFAFSRLRGF